MSRAQPSHQKRQPAFEGTRIGRLRSIPIRPTRGVCARLRAARRIPHSLTSTVDRAKHDGDTRLGSPGAGSASYIQRGNRRRLGRRHVTFTTYEYGDLALRSRPPVPREHPRSRCHQRGRHRPGGVGPPTSTPKTLQPRPVHPKYNPTRTTTPTRTPTPTHTPTPTPDDVGSFRNPGFEEMTRRAAS